MSKISGYIGESAKIFATHKSLKLPALVNATFTLLLNDSVKICVIHGDLASVCVVSALEWRERPLDKDVFYEGTRWALRQCGWHCDPL